MTRAKRENPLAPVRAERIKRARKVRGLSREKLGELCGLTERQVRTLENPDAACEVFMFTHAPKMAKVLGVNTLWLIGEDLPDEKYGVCKMPLDKSED